MICDARIYPGQHEFQRMFGMGKVLNVGCNNDGSDFGKRGGVNVDLCPFDDRTQERNPVHALSDARALPFTGTFDTVVLGEILEHLGPEDAIHSIRQAKVAAKPEGNVLITLPHDTREIEAQGFHGDDSLAYAPGIARFHRFISRGELFGWIAQADLQIRLWARIHYVWGERGTGCICH